MRLVLPALDRILRPRGLAFLFAEYGLLVGLGAFAFSVETAGRWYTAAEIRDFLTAFAGIAGGFLAMQLLLFVALERAFDRRLGEVLRRLEALQAEAVRDAADGAPGGTEAAVPDADAFAELLDEIGAVLEEADAGFTAPPPEIEPEAAAREMEATLASRVRARARVETRLWTEIQQLFEDAHVLGAYLKGPALASGLVFGVSLALRPAADGFLLTFYPLATGLLAADAFATAGIVAYAVLTSVALMRSLGTEAVRRKQPARPPVPRARPG